jgi:hypothetical protein
MKNRPVNKDKIEALKQKLSQYEQQWTEIDAKWDFDALLWDEIEEEVVYSIDDAYPTAMQSSFPDYEHIREVVKGFRETVLKLKALGVEA